MTHSCQYKGCNVPAETGSKFCIFHSPSPKDLEKFKTALSNQLNKVGPIKDRNGRYIFTGYIFPAAIEASGSPTHAIQLPQTIEGDASFDNAQIEGDARFDDALIQGDARFNGALIQGDASFSVARIGGSARFKDAKIEGNISFSGALVGGDASLDGANVKGNASFFNVMIALNAWFNGAQIEGDAWFDDAEIKGDAWFHDAKIERRASFNAVQIGGTVSFRDAQIGEDIWFNGAKIGGDGWFDRAEIKGVARFDDAKIERMLWFGGMTIEGKASFNNSDCGSLELGFHEPRIRGWGDKRCGISITNARSAASFWRFAQRIFSKTEEREKADAAFYFERLNRWRVLRQNKADDDETRIKRLWKNWIIRPGYWALFLLDLLFVRWTTAYGASVARLFFTWFLVIGGFGITFSMVPRLIERAGVQVWSLRNWIVGIHYSVTTFATLGLGRIGPGSSRLGMVLTSIEATFGAVLIALAVLVIGRRFMRQG